MAVKDIRRYESVVCDLEAQPAAQGGILFYGSSTIVRWPREQLISAFEPYQTTFRGFGGSTAEEAYFYYPRLVRPCAPEVLVLYTGDNDPVQGYTAEQAFLLAERLIQAARSDFPTLLILLIGVKPILNQEETNRQRRNYNRLLRQFAAQRPFAVYVDLPGLVQSPDGVPIPEAYQADGVHLSLMGYERLTTTVRQALDDVRRKAAGSNY